MIFSSSWEWFQNLKFLQSCCCNSFVTFIILMAKKLRLINNNCGGVFLVCWEREINNFCMYSVRSAEENEKKEKKRLGP